jgi:hypothetical protein
MTNIRSGMGGTGFSRCDGRDNAQAKAYATQDASEKYVGFGNLAWGGKA